MTAGGNAAETHFGEWWHPSRVIHDQGVEIRDWIAPYRRMGYFDMLEGKPYAEEYDDWDIFSQEGYEHGRTVALEMLVSRISPKWSAERAVPDAFFNHKAIMGRLPAYRHLRHCSKARQENENILHNQGPEYLEKLNIIVNFARSLIGVEMPDGAPLTRRRRDVRVRRPARSKAFPIPPIRTMETKM